ncbi:MAG: DUF6632 domain-containing protein [Longimicrobiales bacterium]
MTQEAREHYLRIALVAIGCIFIVGVLPLMMLWPAGWRWEPYQPEYEQMILGVYATLGIFLLIASRAPDRHRSLILFAGWSSLVHSGIMAIQALRETTERGHLLGDVPALAFAGVVLLVLAPADVHAGRDERVTA